MEAVQQDVNAHMRGILVDWLVEVAQEYKLVSETLFLAVNYIDRFLSCEVAPRRKLQLVGITCMLVAAKYEEIYAPQIEDFCYITDNTYTRDEVLAMEQQVSTGILALNHASAGPCGYMHDMHHSDTRMYSPTHLITPEAVHDEIRGAALSCMNTLDKHTRLTIKLVVSRIGQTLGISPHTR